MQIITDAKKSALQEIPLEQQSDPLDDPSWRGISPAGMEIRMLLQAGFTGNRYRCTFVDPITMPTIRWQIFDLVT